MGKARRTMKQNNKEKEATKTRQRKKQKTKHDDTEEYSNSSTNLNRLSQSWECPVSARKPPIVDPMRIGSSSRRATLRSSKTKNLIETGITNFSRCSRPQKSKEHFASTHATRQLDDLSQVKNLIDTSSRRASLRSSIAKNLIQTGTTNSRCSHRQKPREHFSSTHATRQQDDLAYQVPQSSQVESPSRYLKQGEPVLRREEIEKGRNLAAEENLGDDIAVQLPKMMGEVGEKEVPLLEKSISKVRSLTSSLGLTKFVNMVVGEDDEVDSERCAMDTVKAESMSILRKIQDRHGDIVKNCTASRMLRSTYLQTICDIISQLEGKNLSQIKEDFLLHSIASVDSIKNMEVDIEWLRIFLVDMLEAKKHLGENFGVLKEKKESNKKTIKDAESKLMECQKQKKELSDLLKSKSDEEIVCKEALASLKYREIEKGEKCVDEENTEENLLRNYRALEEMLEEEVSEKEVTLAEKSVDEDNELESQECSISTRQMEIVSSRIASLRSLNTERPIETVMTDLLKSRKHSSATNAIQQLNDLAYQVPQSSQLESPSRYLKQGEPSVRHEDIEKGGNFAAKVNLGDGIAVPLSEMMEKVGEKEMPLVEKPMSVVRSPAFSIKLTEFVNMAVDQDDEVDSQRCAMDTVLGYRVKPEFMAILKKILDRRGDIAKNCTVSIMELRSGLLEMICGIISHLQGKDLKQIKEDFLHHNVALVDGMKNMEIDIEWLRVLLNDLLEAKQQLGGKFGKVKLKEKKDISKKSIEDAERDLAECQERKRKLSAQFKEVKTLLDSTLDEEIVRKETLAKAKDESTKITQTIKCATSNVMRFFNRFSVDDLL